MSVYETQSSTPLPTINNTNNIPISNAPLVHVIENSPILTNSQIVKQLNEMNAKLDKLFALVETLVVNKLEKEET